MAKQQHNATATLQQDDGVGADRTTTSLSRSLWRKAKIYAMDAGMTVQDVVDKAVEQFFAKKGV